MALHIDLLDHMLPSTSGYSRILSSLRSRILAHYGGQFRPHLMYCAADSSLVWCVGGLDRHGGAGKLAELGIELEIF